MSIEPSPLTDDARSRTMPSLIERIVRQMGVTSSAQTVYGTPVEAHGHTVIPVARVYFGYGGGAGPELAGRQGERQADGRGLPAITSGGGAGGLGIARPAGYIEISPSGTRFVPAGRDWKRPLVLACAAVLGILAIRVRHTRVG
jgi:uncharacterized spore protein YtfJ